MGFRGGRDFLPRHAQARPGIGRSAAIVSDWALCGRATILWSSQRMTIKDEDVPHGTVTSNRKQPCR
jgi:hypothetical protein